MAVFRQELMQWFSTNERPLPWKSEQDPYLIWLSETILQQTRVAQGKPYYEAFRAAYPKVEDLAAAPEDEVLKHWQGLGYYARARNLHAAAKYIASACDGRFPESYEEIRKLRGVGDYTAAAIASFAYQLPYAVLDGNVYRVLARYFGISTPIDTGEGKKKFGALAQALLDAQQPGEYNQAIMDFGATQCAPQVPKCATCPLRPTCAAHGADQVATLPVKAKKMARRTRYFNYLVFDYEGQTYLHKRQAKDIWNGLYEFPLIETAQAATSPADLAASPQWQSMPMPPGTALSSVSPPKKQALTHQEILATFWEWQLSAPPTTNTGTFIIVERKNLHKFAFPKVIDSYLQDSALYLKLL